MAELSSTNALFSEVALLVQRAQQRVAISVNAELTTLYWQVGKAIKQRLLQNQNPNYGEQLVKSLAIQLSAQFGKGWSKAQVWNCLRTAEIFPEEQKIYALSRELSWTHLRKLIYIENDLKREFYIEICKLERWSTRQLEKRIGSMLYERTAISKKPEETIKHELQTLKEEKKLNPDLVFRDPYFLDFLGLKDTYSEKDIESAIVAELQRFISEFGSDFAFLARQKRITIDNEDYYIDLLFYHRSLRCLVVIDLKLDAFKAAYKGQMELYLRWLQKYETIEGEESPIGLILCAEAGGEHIELMQLEKSNIKVAKYLTKLPPKKLLQAKLHEAIRIARERLDNKAGDE